MIAFSTIITPDYLHYALALRESLLKFDAVDNFYILITDSETLSKEDIEKDYPGVTILFADDLCKNGIGKKIYDKYFTDFKDEFRWSMKPVLLAYLIEQLHYKKVLCLDCDLFFFNSFNFLLDKLETSNVILTPHWRSLSPTLDFQQYHVLFTHGFFNAGFIGVNNMALDALSWWASACEYACVDNKEYGFYDDQGYLNAMPIYFDNVEIIKHRGCNVAEWNMIECKRTKANNSEVLINDTYPIVFIHFTNYIIQNIIEGKDPLLQNHLDIYSKTLLKYNNQYDIIKKYKLVKANKELQQAQEVKDKASLISTITRKFKRVLLLVTPPIIVKIYSRLKLIFFKPTLKK